MSASSRISGPSSNDSAGNSSSNQSANAASTTPRRRIRCAIYTRKSSEDGLEQEFNSLDAQREASEAYILSQKHDGWIAMPDYYDDGGLSGGTLERPALKRLLEDVSAGKVDVIVVYKVDRLTRSLADFARIVDTLDKHQVSFVSVTQHFNTTSSMGRLTLNVLLSFAQFEREIAGERIRDKIAASKRKGMWMGGTIPFGYEVKDRKLEIVEAEATTLRLMFEMYAKLGTVEALMDYLSEHGISNQREYAAEPAVIGYANQTATQTIDQTVIQSAKQAVNQKSPNAFSRAALHHVLKNPLYIGKITHKGAIYDGLHKAIIDDALWAKVQHQIATSSHERRSGSRAKHPSLLVGMIETEDGHMLTPTHAVKGKVRYRYYADLRPALKGKENTKVETKAGGNTAGSNTAKQILRIPARAIERLVTDRLLQLMQSQTELAVMFEAHNLSATQLRNLIQSAATAAEAWAKKPLSEQRAIVQAMLVKVIPRSNRVELILSRHGLMLAFMEPSGIKAKVAFVTPANAAPAFETPASPTPASETPDSKTPEDDLVSVYTATGLEPSGNGLRLIIKDISHPTVNIHLAPLIGEAFALREALLNGPHDSIEAMSKAFQTTNGYISARIRLTYLSPSLIKKILNGDVPNTISPTRLIDASKDLPVKWAEQDQFIEALAR